MAGIRRADWEDIIHETALNAADAWRKYNEANEHKITDEGERNTYEKVFNRLMQEYPYEGATMDTMKALYEYKPETVWRWVINGTADPRKEREALEASKFLPYLMGHEKDWTQTPTKALQEMATNDLKYPYTKEGYAQFLRELGAQQEKADRAQVLKELRSMPQYYAAMAAYPSLVEAIDNAVAEGKDLTPEEKFKLFLTDGAVDLGQFVAPGMGNFQYVKNPYVNSAIGAGMQGIAETGRQLMKNEIDPDLNVDLSAPVAATTLGLTRPGMIGAVRGYAGQFKGPTAQNFSRGIMGATKAGDPMDIERDKIAELAAIYNKMLGMDDGLYVKPIVEKNKLLKSMDIRNIGEVLHVKPEADGTYSAKKLLEAYGKNLESAIRKKGNSITIAPDDIYRADESKTILLSPSEETKYSSYLPSKYSFEDAASMARSAGLWTGKFLDDIGGRIEPIVKANPISASFLRDYIPSYRKEAWYKKLSEEQRKVIDDAMKEKEEE